MKLNTLPYGSHWVINSICKSFEKVGEGWDPMERIARRHLQRSEEALLQEQEVLNRKENDEKNSISAPKMT